MFFIINIVYKQSKLKYIPCEVKQYTVMKVNNLKQLVTYFFKNSVNHE